MKKHLKRISAFLLVFILVFGMSGIVAPETAEAQGYWSCVMTDEGTLGSCALKMLVISLMNTVLSIAGLFTGLAGVVLNGVVFHTVVNVAQNYANITAIASAWSTVRDLANMVFIFLLLYAAIRIILGWGEDSKRLIVNIIIVAILINFSLFFTRIVIDTSNILALFFYSAINGGSLPTGFSLDESGISDQFMDNLNLTSLYNTANIDAGSIFTIGIMGTAMLMIAAFVFFSVAIMFMVRYVVLILVLILSPLAFLSYAFPALREAGSKWLNALIGQAFFAPIYFMITWIALRVLGDIATAFGMSAGGAREALADLATSGVGDVEIGTFTVFMNFMVVIIFLMASLTIAKSWAHKAGSGAQKVNRWMTGAAGGAALGLAGRAGRYTMGAGAEVFKESKTYKRLEAASPNSAFARLTLAAADKTRRASFDVRGTKLGGMLGAGAAGGQGGFEAERKGVREFFERPGTESRKQRLERGRKAQGELDIMNGIGPAAIPQASRTPQQQTAVDGMERAVARSTDKEIEVIVDSNRSLLQSQEFANSLSVKQLEALNKSDKFSEAEKDTLKNLRFGQIYGALAAGGPVSQAVRGRIRGLSDSELEMINPTHLTNDNFVSQLRSGQIDSINRSSKFTTMDKDNLRNTRRGPLAAAIRTGNTAGVATAVRNLGAREVASLDRTVLMSREMLETYTPELLKRMAPDMEPADVQDLRNAIEREALSYSAPGTPRIPAQLNRTYAWLTSPNNTFGT